MKFSSLTSLFTITVFLFSTTAVAADVIATVNGKNITQKDLDEYHKYRQAAAQQNIPNDESLLHEMINRELLYKEAVKKKVDKDAEVKYLVEQQKRDVYIKYLLSTSEVAKPVEEAEMKKIYDDNIKTKRLPEYDVKHILLKTEGEAKAVIAELDGGAVFEDVAKNKSTGPSAKEGGAIGWVNPAQLKQMPSFAQAVAEMKKGTHSKKPVQTQYGWHVIRVEDSREMEPPTYDQVKQQIAKAIRQQRLAEYMKTMRDKAKVDIKKK